MRHTHLPCIHAFCHLLCRILLKILIIVILGSFTNSLMGVCLLKSTRKLSVSLIMCSMMGFSRLFWIWHITGQNQCFSYSLSLFLFMSLSLSFSPSLFLFLHFPLSISHPLVLSIPTALPNFLYLSIYFFLYPISGILTRNFTGEVFSLNNCICMSTLLVMFTYIHREEPFRKLRVIN